MSYLNWHVGMKVVCVDAHGSSNLIQNAVYTIIEIGSPRLLRWRGNLRIAPEIYLAETSPRPGMFGFAPERFRPVQKRSADISIFTAMLTKTSVDA